jgi:hypothetical protein
MEDLIKKLNYTITDDDIAKIKKDTKSINKFWYYNKRIIYIALIIIFIIIFLIYFCFRKK